MLLEMNHSAGNSGERRWTLRTRPASAVVTYSQWRPLYYPLILAAAVVIGLAVGFGISPRPRGGVLGRNEWHLWTGWERETLPTVLFNFLGIGPDPDARAGEGALRNDFRLTSAISAAAPTDPAKAEALTVERQEYENAVERYVANLIDEAVSIAGVQRDLPLFEGVRFTWPPVNFELTTPPKLLIRSPRTSIRRAGDTLLKNDLSLADTEAIERETDTADVVSIVEPIGGLAAYPAVVSADRSYDGWLDTTAHEWIHHYLAFFPLGQEWHRGGDSITLNETVASLGGREIAKIIRQRHPLKLPAGQDGSAPPRTCDAPPIDFVKEMGALRLQVDALLAAGMAPEARIDIATGRKRRVAIARS